MASLSPIPPHEVVLRRIPKQKGMAPDLKSVLPGAFAPITHDTDGLSVHLASIHTPKQVAQDFRGKGTQPVWVAHLRAIDIFALGLTIVPDPIPESLDPPRPAQPGHAIIPELNASNANTDSTKEIGRRLAELVFQLDGPFDPPPQTPPTTPA